MSNVPLSNFSTRQGQTLLPCQAFASSQTFNNVQERHTSNLHPILTAECSRLRQKASAECVTAFCHQVECCNASIDFVSHGNTHRINAVLWPTSTVHGRLATKRGMNISFGFSASVPLSHQPAWTFCSPSYCRYICKTSAMKINSDGCSFPCQYHTIHKSSYSLVQVMQWLYMLI